jgi:hypothetical protein
MRISTYLTACLLALAATACDQASLVQPSAVTSTVAPTASGSERVQTMPKRPQTGPFQPTTYSVSCTQTNTTASYPDQIDHITFEWSTGSGSVTRTIEVKKKPFGTVNTATPDSSITAFATFYDTSGAVVQQLSDSCG